MDGLTSREPDDLGLLRGEPVDGDDAAGGTILLPEGGTGAAGSPEERAALEREGETPTPPGDPDGRTR